MTDWGRLPAHPLRQSSVSAGGSRGTAVTCGPSDPGVPGGPTSPFLPCVQKKKAALAGRQAGGARSRVSVEIGGFVCPSGWQTVPWAVLQHSSVGLGPGSAAGSGVQLASQPCSLGDFGHAWPQIQRDQKGMPEKHPPCPVLSHTAPFLEDN